MKVLEHENSSTASSDPTFSYIFKNFNGKDGLYSLFLLKTSMISLSTRTSKICLDRLILQDLKDNH